MSNTVWFMNPSILFNEKYMYEIVPNDKLSINRNINALTRLIILVCVVLFLLSKKISILLSGILSLAVIYLIYSYHIQKTVETFDNNIKKEKYGSVTSNNPLNNVLMTDSPDRLKAPNAFGMKNNNNINDSVKEMIAKNNASNPKISDKIFKNLGENFEFDRSMNQFYTTANTTIPNDQKSFSEFCYGGMGSGKEGDKHQLMKYSQHTYNHHT
jgi:Ca2+/Na+ antiporter